MANNTSSSTGSQAGELVEGIVDDAGRLIEQQFQLLRSEMAQEFEKVRNAAVSLGSGAGLVAVSGVLGTLWAVHFLHEKTRLSLSSCYCLVSGLLGVAGVSLLATGAAEASRVRLIPKQTAETLREDAQSLKRAVGATAD